MVHATIIAKKNTIIIINQTILDCELPLFIMVGEFDVGLITSESL